jgi:DNA-directed RNA polymerase sigma subunit (sigma70/sigma32)
MSRAQERIMAILLLNDLGHPLRDIAKTFKLSTERVRQIVIKENTNYKTTQHTKTK